MQLRETIKQEIDTLSESQLRKIAEMIASLKPRSQCCTEYLGYRFK